MFCKVFFNLFFVLRKCRLCIGEKVDSFVFGENIWNFFLVEDFEEIKNVIFGVIFMFEYWFYIRGFVFLYVSGNNIIYFIDGCGDLVR